MRGQDGPVRRHSRCRGSAQWGREGCRTHRKPSNISIFQTPSTISNPFFKPTSHSDPLPGQRQLSSFSCNLVHLGKCSFIQNLLQSCSLILPPALLVPTKTHLSTDSSKNPLGNTKGSLSTAKNRTAKASCKAVKKEVFGVSSSSLI